MFLAVVFVLVASTTAVAQDVTHYVRYEYNGNVSYGVLEGDTIHELRGDVFESTRRTGRTVQISQVRLLTPTAPKKVIAVGLNYKSHIGDSDPAAYPGLFAKYPTSLIPHNGTITYYEDATNLHYEGEMVLIIGKVAKSVTVEDAPDYIFAVAPGNDSERAGLAAQRSAMVPCQGRRHLRARRSGHGQRRQLQRSVAGDSSQRRGQAVAADQGPDLRLCGDRQLRQQVRHPGTGRYDLYRDTGCDQRHAAW